MVALSASVLVTFAALVSPVIPGPIDATGWGLRVRLLSPKPPLFVGESSEQVRIEILLLNRTTLERTHVRLNKALATGTLTCSIVEPGGKEIRRVVGSMGPGPDRVDDVAQLSGHEFVSTECRLSVFGYFKFHIPGDYTIRLMLVTSEGQVVSLPAKIIVGDPSVEQVISRQILPLVGTKANPNLNERQQAVIDQVRLGNRVLLMYRRIAPAKSGGDVSFVARLAELTGPSEVHVEGAYGEARKPLTVTYGPPGRRIQLTVNSTDGTIEKTVTEDD
jgi:hypothetical protein